MMLALCLSLSRTMPRAKQAMIAGFRTTAHDFWPHARQCLATRPQRSGQGGTLTFRLRQRQLWHRLLGPHTATRQQCCQPLRSRRRRLLIHQRGHRSRLLCLYRSLLVSPAQSLLGLPRHRRALQALPRGRALRRHLSRRCLQHHYRLAFPRVPQRCSRFGRIARSVQAAKWTQRRSFGWLTPK